MIDTNIITRNNYLYHLSQLEYGSPEWGRAMDSLLIEAGRLEGKHEENERQFREAINGQSFPLELHTLSGQERL